MYREPEPATARWAERERPGVKKLARAMALFGARKSSRTALIQRGRRASGQCPRPGRRSECRFIKHGNRPAERENTSQLINKTPRRQSTKSADGSLPVSLSAASGVCSVSGCRNIIIIISPQFHSVCVWRDETRERPQPPQSLRVRKMYFHPPSPRGPRSFSFISNERGRHRALVDYSRAIV